MNVEQWLTTMSRRARSEAAPTMEVGDRVLARLRRSAAESDSTLAVMAGVSGVAAAIVVACTIGVWSSGSDPITDLPGLSCHGAAMSDTFSPADHAPSALAIRPRRRRWVSVLLGLILFLSGGLIGSGLTARAIIRGAQHRLHHPEEFPARATARLRRSLDLSDAQAAAVESVLRTRQAAIQEIRRDFQPKIEAEIDKLGTDVAGVLTPDQAARWKAALDEKRRVWIPPVPPGPGTPHSRP